ncbi:MarR family transcriptional regulator [Bradyrhizobium sp. CCBAU 11357]|uniref:MarR family transcriptional regulator n=1 Tax=Bradyrhizobium sp. CCBAU 11357 TaxID=1630808 RepID=UPI0023024C62|nr:MarR family transcriptional regulator [Bradyrhizobium sp. CCBAU 11357]
MTPVLTTKREATHPRTIETLDVIKRFMLEMSGINSRLEELHKLWGKALGISRPQWMILLALFDLEKSRGLPVNVVAKLLHVDSSFVTTQSKLLEQKGLLRRTRSRVDVRVVKMSLSAKARRSLTSLAEQFRAVRKFVFEGFNEDGLAAFTANLVSVNKRLETISLRIATEFDWSNSAGHRQSRLADHRPLRRTS